LSDGIVCGTHCGLVNISSSSYARDCYLVIGVAARAATSQRGTC
jgi:hypothetical protein